MLTQKKVNALPIGTKIKIKWSGNTKIYKYVIKDKVGELSCVEKFNPNAGWCYGQIDFVGKEEYHTNVWLNNSN